MYLSGAAAEDCHHAKKCREESSPEYICFHDFDFVFLTNLKEQTRLRFGPAFLLRSIL